MEENYRDMRLWSSYPHSSRDIDERENHDEMIEDVNPSIHSLPSPKTMGVIIN